MDACLLEIGPRARTRDEFATFLCEASNIVNHTPLSSISCDPNDALPISPASLLYLRDQREPSAYAQKSTATAIFKPVSRAWQPRAGLQWLKADQPTEMA